MKGPKRKVPLQDMAAVCKDEAARIGSTQFSLVRSGQLSEPDPAKVQVMEAFEAAAWVLEKISDNEASFREWLKTVTR